MNALARGQMRRVGYAALAIVAIGCSSSVERLLGTSAHQVFISAGAPQAVTGGWSVYLNIVNQSFATAYVQPCGDDPALTIEKSVNGQWQSTLAVTCPVSSNSGPIQLMSGDSILINRVFSDSGQFRAGVSVGTTPSLSDAATAWTTGFIIP
ncbi:MAG TPA: hypothetical protein VIJ16_02185 [Gemmatimonadaceae bacterium]